MEPTALNVIVDNFVEMTEQFSEVAAGDGLAPLLVLAGTLLIVFAIGVFGLLTLGAVSSLFSSSSS
ncbi:hypothetical protein CHINAEXTREME_06985 [Halobiforma lacisalsi AJ5]|uniref:Uncharacterized protein n=2 Tax=Natronobacterium TaxID=2256 RepID=M0LU59_NATLA|nr:MULTISPECIES: hypothetical protein [Halobiforma]APW97533.1 hypothetical protein CHINAEXTREME_06985 [Halobiforma lacisalsi AJ5]EMA37087.1 hypothetical protein C445_02566 [Halobiforma lacisalsi AJ5]SFB81255.1 hypothetical protein SAMN05444422_102150 [Halobiforma haloterrestris]